MKEKAEEIVTNLRALVKELHDRKKEGAVYKSKQLKVIQGAMKNLQQDSIKIPDEMISLENRLKEELEQESHIINEVYDYLKAEVMTIFDVEFQQANLKNERDEEKINEKVEESIQEEVKESTRDKKDEQVLEEPKKKKIKKVIMNDDSQISMRPSFRFRQR